MKIYLVILVSICIGITAVAASPTLYVSPQQEIAQLKIKLAESDKTIKALRKRLDTIKQLIALPKVAKSQHIPAVVK
jgi:predicted RNase H-like nuclease (RuvC/YqgF family)